MKKSPKITRTYRLDARTLKALEKIARLERRSMGNVIEVAVEKYGAALRANG